MNDLHQLACAEWIGRPAPSGPQFVTDLLAVDSNGNYCWPRARHTAPIGMGGYFEAHVGIDELQVERNL
jgi:hypothetical protein